MIIPARSACLTPLVSVGELAGSPLSGAELGATAALGILSQSSGHDFDRNFAAGPCVLGPIPLPIPAAPRGARFRMAEFAPEESGMSNDQSSAVGQVMGD